MSEVVARFSLENNPLNVRYSLSDGSEVDAIFKINAAGTTWGSIDGTLSNQTDLQNALNLKADKAELDADIQEVNTSINTLSQTVTANYNALDGKIDTEISSRTLADTTLQNNIDAEALARQNADTTLQGNINTLSQTVTDNNTAINNRVDGVVSAFDDEIENINNNISDLSDTVSDNYTDLNDKISDNAGDITDINNTINTYGDIVTYNAADFATSTQGALADSALQPGDNISALVNNVGYITSASLPTDYVPNTRTINGYALSSNITLNYSDVGALSSSTTINDLTTTAQQNALNSGATTTNIGQIATNTSDISDLQTNKQDVLTAGVNIQINNNVISATDTTYTAGTGISIINGVISNTQTSAEWGNITGVLSSQTDLQDALDDKYDASNPSGYITGITSSDVTTALGYTPYDSSNPNGYTSNVGTVTSVNNVSPVSGNVTLSIPTDTSDLTNGAGFITGITSSDVTTALGYTPYNSTNPNGYITGSALTGYATETWVGNQGYITGITSSDVTTALGYTPLSNATKYGSSLSYSSNVLQLLDQDGNSLGSSVIIQSSPDIDNKSITTNSSDELQTVGVIDQNNTTNAIKTWTGTRQQYDAIVTKDANTLYNITDDSDVTFALLELLFPVGAVYFGTMSVCPLQTLGIGTWQALPQDKVIQIAGTRGSVGDTLNESLPNITAGEITVSDWGDIETQVTGAWAGHYNTNTTNLNSGTTATEFFIDFNASRCSSTYQDNAPVQQDAYLLNGWRRIA